MDRQGIFERLHMKERDPGLHTYSDTRSGRGGGESRDFLRPSGEAIFFVMKEKGHLCAMSGASGGLGRAKRRGKRRGVAR